MTELLSALRLPAVQLLDAGATPMGAHDASGRVVWVSRALCRLFGVKAELLIGRVLHKGLVPSEQEKYLAHMAHWSRGEARELVVEIRAVGGPPARYLLLPAPVIAADGVFLGVVYAILPASVMHATFEDQLRSTAGLARSMLDELADELNSPSVSVSDELERLRTSIPALARLSPREWEVARRLASGGRTPCIAADLGISENTVRNHLKAIFRKVGVGTQSEFIGCVRAWSGQAPHRPARGARS